MLFQKKRKRDIERGIKEIQKGKIIPKLSDNNKYFQKIVKTAERAKYKRKLCIIDNEIYINLQKVKAREKQVDKKG